MIDPGFEAIVIWFQSGAPLDHTVAVAALGALLRFVVVPIAEWVMTKVTGQEFTSVYKLQLVNVCGVVLTLAIGLATKSTTPLSQQVLIGFMSAASAVGIHQFTNKAQRAAKALRDQKKKE